MHASNEFFFFHQQGRAMAKVGYEMVEGYSNYPPYKHIRNRFGVTTICYVHNALKKGICHQILYSYLVMMQRLYFPQTPCYRNTRSSNDEITSCYFYEKGYENLLHNLTQHGAETRVLLSNRHLSQRQLDYFS